MTIQTNINSPEPVNLSIHGSITLPRVEGFIFKDMKRICVEIDGVFYGSMSYAEKMIGHDERTVKKRCLSNKFPNYKITPFRITYAEKRCTKCEKMKLLKEFPIDKKSKDNLSVRCKECCSISGKERYKDNVEHMKEYGKEYRKNNLEYIKEYNSRSEVKAEKNKKLRERRKTDIAFRVNGSMSVALWRSLKGKKNGASLESLVDWTIEELIAHLESKFTEGMSWDNYGRGKYKWNIDHIIAQSKFNIISNTCQEFKDCWALKNLQPLWVIRNKEKSNKPMETKYLIKPDCIK